jgi:hypothetical protein
LKPVSQISAKRELRGVKGSQISANLIDTRSVLALKLEDIYRQKAKENLKTPTGGRNALTLQNSAKSIINTQFEFAKRTSAGRHADLGFSHHREVASLSPEKQGGGDADRGLFIPVKSDALYKTSPNTVPG